MGLLLCCDAPGCINTVPAVVKNGRPAAPDGWWMQPVAERVLVGCCDDHVIAASKRKEAA